MALPAVKESATSAARAVVRNAPVPVVRIGTGEVIGPLEQRIRELLLRNPRLVSLAASAARFSPYMGFVVNRVIPVVNVATMAYMFTDLAANRCLGWSDWISDRWYTSLHPREAATIHGPASADSKYV